MEGYFINPEGNFRTSRHNIHKSYTHRENTFKRSGVVTATRMVGSDGVGVGVGAQ